MKKDFTKIAKDIKPSKIYGTGEIAKTLGLGSHKASQYIIKKFSSEKILIGGSPDMPRYGLTGKVLISYILSFKKQ